MDRKKKIVSVTGGYRAGPAPDYLREDLKAFVAQQMRGGAQAAPAGNTLQVRGGETAQGATAKPRSAAAIARSLEGKSPTEVMNAVGVMSKAEQETLATSIKRGTISDPKIIAGTVALWEPKDRASYMQKTTQLDGLKKLMRAGELPENVAVGVGLRVMADTKWAKANPAVVKDLQKAYATGALRLALEDSQIAGLGQTSGTGVELAKQLKASPEAMAATLAHEGVHLHSGGGGCCTPSSDATPTGEVAGMRAGAEVWAQIGKRDDPNLKPGALGILNASADAAKSGDKQLRDKVLGWYTGFYQTRRDDLQGKVDKWERWIAQETKAKRPVSEEDEQKRSNLKSQLEFATAKANEFQAAWKANDATK